eukprot:1826161-Rhodomonas_salina.1
MVLSRAQVAGLAGRIDHIRNVGADDLAARRDDLADAASASRCLRDHGPLWWRRQGWRRVLQRRESVHRWGVRRWWQSRRWRSWGRCCQGRLDSRRQVELWLSWRGLWLLVPSGSARHRGRGRRLCFLQDALGLLRCRVAESSCDRPFE